MSVKTAKFGAALALLGLLGSGSAMAQTLTATEVSAVPGTAAQSVQFNYAAGGNVSIVITNINVTDANNIRVTPVFQQFNSGTNAFVNCDGTNRFAIAGSVRILCTAGGRYTIQTLDPNVDPLPALTNLARATFDIAGGATAGQTATYSFAPNCGAGEAPNANNCTEFTNTAATRVAGTLSDTGIVTVSAGPQGPTLTAPGTTTLNLGGGVQGTQLTSNIQFTAAGGDAGQTRALNCTATAPAVIVSGGTQNVATGSQPAPVVAGITLTAAAQSGSITCNGTVFTVNADAGTPPMGPTLTAPAQTTITLAPVLVGQQATAGIQFTATGGQAGQSTPLNCTATAPAVIVSGGTQSVATGSQAAAVVVGVTLTGAAQSGSVTCNGTAFTINAPAGSTLEPASVVPASSLWSQLSLIALFAALGGVFVALRRNA